MLVYQIIFDCVVHLDLRLGRFLLNLWISNQRWGVPVVKCLDRFQGATMCHNVPAVAVHHHHHSVKVSVPTCICSMEKTFMLTLSSGDSRNAVHAYTP